VIAKILCPLCLSDSSRRTLEHALALGRWYDADVAALHVFATWMPPASLSTYPGWMRRVPEARAQIEQELRDLVEPAKATGVDMPLTIREGDPVSEILKHAVSIRADLIVLGAHAPSGFDRLTRGSVTEKVLSKATSAVLVVPTHGSTASQPFAGYRRIMCAIDLSDGSREVLTYALSIAQRARASVTLVHVVEALDAPEMADDRAAFEALRSSRIETAQGLLRTTAEEHQTRGCAIDNVVRPGASHREIPRIAGELNADLLVMGARGRRAVDRPVSGSTSIQVVRRPPCAVLTVRTT
jgi:nucleotide-binding universal stress UspA family protein